jgi:hypothetical protein
MPIDKENNIIFVHIPKCAGTSIAKSLNIYSEHNKPPNMNILYGITENNIVLQSLCLEYYQNYIDKNKIKECKIITVVRNPYDRVLSDFMWHNRGFNNILDFCKFIKKTLIEKNKYELMQHEPQFYINHILPQVEYINNTNYKNIIIMKLENLKNDFYTNFPSKQLFHENTTDHEKYSDYFKDKKDCVRLINEIYKEDFIKFGYDFL